MDSLNTDNIKKYIKDLRILDYTVNDDKITIRLSNNIVLETKYSKKLELLIIKALKAELVSLKKDNVVNATIAAYNAFLAVINMYISKESKYPFLNYGCVLLCSGLSLVNISYFIQKLDEISTIKKSLKSKNME